MALTIVSNPGVNHALYGNETQFKVSTDRVIGSGNAVVISSVTDGGEATFNTAAAHLLNDNDIVVISGTSNYDGTYVADVLNSTTFEVVGLTYAGADTGTATPSNLNFKVKCEIQNTAGTIVYATKYIYPVSDFFYLDLDNILKSFIKTGHQDFGTNSVIGATGIDANVLYKVVFTEYFDDEDGVQTSGSTVTSADITAFNMSSDYDATEYKCQDQSNKFLATCPRLELADGGDWQLHFNADEDCRLLVAYTIGIISPGDSLFYQFYPASATVMPENERVIFPMNELHLDKTLGYFTNPHTLSFIVTVISLGFANTAFSNSGGFSLFTSVAHGLSVGDYIFITGTDSIDGFQTVTATPTANTYVTDKAYEAAEGDNGTFYNVLSESLSVYKKDLNCNQVTLQFLNQVGGFDNFTFLNETQKTTVSRENYKSGGVDLQRNKMARRTRHLISDWLSDDWLDFVEQLLTSPEIYLLEASEWKRVNLVTSQMKYRDNDLINLEIDVIGQELNIIK